MSILEILGSEEQQIVKLALSASVVGPFFPDWEFETLFGVSRMEVSVVAERWPENLRDAATEPAVFNALTNLYGYPHGIALGEFGLDRDMIGAVLERLREHET
jgi:hypothetical protein